MANEFSAAFGSGDIETACSLWDPSVWKGMPTGFDCEGIYGGKSTAFERSFLTADIERVVISGSSATVAFSNDEIVRFEKVGDRWLVENLGGAENSIG